MTGAPSPYEHLEAHMNLRRLELRLTWAEVADRAGISRDTLHRVRRGKDPNVRDLTKAGIENSLGWSPGSVDAVLAGGEPTPVEEWTVRRAPLWDPAAGEPPGELRDDNEIYIWSNPREDWQMRWQLILAYRILKDSRERSEHGDRNETG